MSALNRAISTESRRIRREISVKQAEKWSQVDVVKNKVNVRDRIRQIYARILLFFKKKPQTRIGYTELVGKERMERIASFLPLLHLDNQQKVWLEQEKHFDEIWIWLYELYKKEHKLEQLEEDIEEVKEELDSEQEKRIEKINKDFENPLANLIDEAEEERKSSKV